MNREMLDYIRSLVLECKKNEDIVKLRDLDIENLVKRLQESEDRVFELRKDINTLEVKLSNKK